MYVLRKRANQSHATLIEMSQAEYVAALESDFKNMLCPEGRSSHKRIPAEQARKWVKDGIHHETGLWVDMDGKVRYAKCDPYG